MPARFRLAGVTALAVAIVAGLPAAQSATPPASQVPPLDQVLPVDPAVRTGTLGNGLRYYVRQNGRPASRVSLRLAVDVGSVQEADDQRGLAHFLEHMAFNGTEHFRPGELVAFLESIGARFGPHVNASTSFDETIYMLDVPTDREGYVERGLLALSDFAAGMSLLPEEIEKERGVVIEEWRGRLGAGSRLVDRQLPVLLRGSRYADRLPIGTLEILKSFPRQRLVDFYATWYRPDLMAVVVVGDIDPAVAVRLVEERFGGIPRPTSPAPDVARTVPSHQETLYSSATDPEAQGWTVTVAWKRAAEAQVTVADYRQSLVRQLASTMLNLRLREIARRADAPFLGASAGGGGLVRPVEVFQMGAAVQPGRIAEGLTALVVEARRMREFGFWESELATARAQLLASFERGFKERDTAESRTLAAEYTRAFLEQEPIPGIEFEYRIASGYLPTVTPAEALAAARQLVHDDNRVVLAVAPESATVPAPTDVALRDTMARAAAAAVEPWRDAASGRALVERPPAPGRVTARRTIDVIGVTVLSLSNGAEVWLKPTGFKNDQVLFSAYAPGGTSLASRDDFPDASLVGALVGTGGLGGHNPVELSRLLAGSIAQAQPDIDLYTHGVRGSATPRDLETALTLAFLVFTAPNLEPDALGLLERRYAGMLANQTENPEFVFAEKVALVNTSNHYTAKALTLQDIEALDLDVMRRFYAARFANAADFTFFIVGAFAVDEVVPLVERWVASLPSTGSRASAFRDVGVRFPTGIVREEVRKGREPASQTVMSFFADTGLDEIEMHRARAAASVAGIRLRDILREQLGGTYGVSVAYQSAMPMKNDGAIVIQFGSAPENVETLTTAVLTEVERLRREGPSADDVRTVQELERRDLETSLRQNQYWLNSLQTTHLLGWDATGIARRADRIGTLTPDVLRDAFRKYFPADRYTVVTLRPER